MRSLFLTTFLLLSFSASATTVTLNFEEFTSPDLTNVLQTQGFRFRSDQFFASGIVVEGSPAIGLTPPEVRLELIDESNTFSLASWDILGDQADTEISVVGYLEGGGAVNASFTAVSGVYTTYNFSSEWQNLEYVEFSHSDPVVADNIVASVIPIPAF